MHVLLIYPNRPRLSYGFMPGPYGLEILRAHLQGLPVECDIVNPFLSASPARALADALRPDTILIGVSMRNLDDALVLWSGQGERDEMQTESCVEDVELVVDLVRQMAPGVPVLMGGAAFGHMPHRLLRFLGVEFGLRGAPERQFGALVRAMTAGAPFRDAVAKLPGAVCAGLPVLGGPAPDLSPAGEAIVRERESLYFRFRAEAAVRTYSGCPLNCSHCVEHVGSRQIRKSATERVAREVQALLDGYPEVRRIFLADSEVNLAGEERTSELLRAIRRRTGDRGPALAGYFNPRPLGWKLLNDLRQFRCEARLTVDHVSDTILSRNGKNFRKRHLEEIVAQYTQLGMELSFSVLLGQPGETRGTVDEVLDFVERIPDSIRGPIYFSPGVRVYPETPIERQIQDGSLDRRWLVGSHADTGSAVRPLVYCESWHPRDLFEYVRSRAGGLLRPMNGYLSDLPSAERDRLEAQFADYHIGAACLGQDDDGAWAAWSHVDPQAPFLTGRQRDEFLWQRGGMALGRGQAARSIDDWRLLEARLEQVAAPDVARRKVAHNLQVARRILEAESLAAAG